MPSFDPQDVMKQMQVQQYAQPVNSGMGGMVGQSTSGGLPLTTGNYPNYYPAPLPAAPDWTTVVSLQRTIMALQTTVMELQEKLNRLQQTKDWLVGPETPGPGPTP